MILRITYGATGINIFLVWIILATNFLKLESHVCRLEKRIDPAGKLRWSLPKVERCFCQRVIAPRRFRSQTCAGDKDNITDLWFVDDPTPLTNRRNWLREKFDVLLEREECAVLYFTTSLNPQDSSETTTHGSGSKADKSSTNSETSDTYVTSETTLSTEGGTSEYYSTTASESISAESSTYSENNDPSKTSEVTSTEAKTSKHAGTTALDRAAGESSTSSATSVPSYTSEATITETVTSEHAGTTASGSKASESSTDSVTSVPTETSGATNTNVRTSIKTGPTSSISTSRSPTTKVCNEHLGMENSDIPDGNIAASHFPSTYSPSNGRLNGDTHWGCVPSSCTSETTPWIQADIGYQTYVSGVITQGSGTHENWVTALKVSTFEITTNDQEAFVTDGNGQVKVFQANTDKDTPVTSTFPIPVFVRIVRITCISRNTRGAYWNMRFEIIGCK